jgi:hypothetical protein
MKGKMFINKIINLGAIAGNLMSYNLIGLGRKLKKSE